MSRIFKYFSAILVTAVMLTCTGCSSDSTESVATTYGNTPPSANLQSLSFAQNSSDNVVKLTGVDLDGDTLTYSILSNPTNGTIGGTIPNLLYTPNTDYLGGDTFTFKVNDGTDDSATATVSITVSVEGSINTAPVANNQNISVDIDSTDNTITLSGSDADSDTLTYTVVSNPTNGTITGTAPNLLYTPNTSFSGSDTFTFKVNDGISDSVVATISITVNASSNTTPVANDQNISVDMDSTDNTITLSGSDADSDTLTYTIASNPANGSLSGTAPNVLYTPSGGYMGNDSFTFTVNDGTDDSAVATVNITVGFFEVTSPFTSRVWMDRNLGASQVCTDYNDTLCYGDYYQWGREADGHHELNSTTTTILATDYINVGSDLILDINTTGDWVTAGVDDDKTLRSFNWSKTDGTSICPIGFRVPTSLELMAEFDPVVYDVNTSEYLYEDINFLKVSKSGFRSPTDGNYTEQGFYVYLYASGDVNETILFIDPDPFSGFHGLSTGVTSGKNVRCIKD